MTIRADSGRARQAAGFTLVEILAVVVIIGIVTGIAVISLKALDGRSEQGQTATRLAGLIQLASENARLENIQYGLRVEPHRYEFMQFQAGTWIAVNHDPVLAGRSVPDGMELSVDTREQIAIPVAATASGSVMAAINATAGVHADTGARALTPQIAILSTGETTPFTLRLSSDAGKTYTLRSNGNGQIHVEPPATDAPGAATY